jgi:glutaredoxin
MTIEVMTRKRCPQCKGEGQYLFVGSHGRESWSNCVCADPNNLAGTGYQVDWVLIDVKETM